jgi:flagellar hook-associated protein 1 FlgK
MELSLTLPGQGSSTPIGITDAVSGGRLGGNLLERNTTLNERMASLDELAFGIIEEVNNLHSAGYNLDGATGINFFEPLASQDAAARNFRLDAAIDLSLNNIAAAQEDPAISGVGDNRNALALADLASTRVMNSNSQSFLEFYQEMVGTIGTTAGSVQRDFETQANLLTQLDIQRESVSGVNMDEEGANIIRFQRAFQASSRLIMVADELMQSILEI